MNKRRTFIRMFPALAAIPAAAASWSEPKAGLLDQGFLLGAWNSVHNLPFPPGSFRELISFDVGGAIHETNTFLHTASNLDFSMFGLPSTVNASDGIGGWKLSPTGVQAVFRKLLFDAAKTNFGDLLVTGTVRVRNGTFQAEWDIQVVNANSGAVMIDFGLGTSTGSRIG